MRVWVCIFKLAANEVYFCRMLLLSLVFPYLLYLFAKCFYIDGARWIVINFSLPPNEEEYISSTEKNSIAIGWHAHILFLHRNWAVCFSRSISMPINVSDCRVCYSPQTLFLRTQYTHTPSPVSRRKEFTVSPINFPVGTRSFYKMSTENQVA